MKIEIIVPIYNEELILPFFLKHYNWVDQINILLANDTNDNTLEILSKTINPKIKIIENTEIKIDHQVRKENVMNIYNNIDADWVINVDCDEFIFINKEYFSNIKKNITVIKTILYDVYRHITENDLDINKPIMEQRRHGYLLEPFYIKPSIIKAKKDIDIGIGNHGVSGSEVVYNDKNVIGAHWKNASWEIAVNRIRNKRGRRSKNDLSKEWGKRDWYVTEEDIKKDFKLHENDPQVF